MIDNFDELKTQLKELSEVINAFNSESVQLRLLELIFDSPQRKKPISAKETAIDSGTGKDTPLKKEKVPSAKNNISKKAPKASGRPGGKTTLSKLHEDNFFSKSKTIKSIIEHCDHNLSLKYKQSDFSGALGRYVRDGKLKRVKNDEKQYEYSNA